MQSAVPVVLVEGNLNNLGVVRSLSRGRMPIFVLTTTRNCAAGWSRFSTVVPIKALEGDALIDSLIALAKKLGNRPVLILGGEQSVETVSTHRDRVGPFYRLNLPSTDMVRTLNDKTSFQMLAEREGFPVPRATAVNNKTDLQMVRKLVPPLIIKPADKTLVLRGLVERVVRADTLAQAELCISRMLASSPQVIVQEWIDGPDSDIFFTLFSCDAQGNMIANFTGRKLVCDPPEIGNTAICMPAPEVASELQKLTVDFCARVQFRGLGSLEFKRDSRTGRFIIIEPTVGRTDYQEEIATLCGVNLPLLTYRAELNQPAGSAGERHRTLAWRSSMGHRKPPGSMLRGIRVVDGYFRWSDPLPAIYYYGVERCIRRIWGRAARYYRNFTTVQRGTAHG